MVMADPIPQVPKRADLLTDQRLVTAFHIGECCGKIRPEEHLTL